MGRIEDIEEIFKTPAPFSVIAEDQRQGEHHKPLSRKFGKFAV